ncbi:MAG: alpha/beta hydrolase [Mycobacteriales bacterium]
MRRGLAAAVLLLLATGCGGGRAHHVAANPSPAPTFALSGCVREGEGQIFHQPVDGVLLGSGPRGVVLSHQSDGNLCQWLDFGRQLAGQGYHVALWDCCGADPAASLASVVTLLRQAGASKVTLVGASMGAKISIIGGAQVSPPVDGVVALSPEEYLRAIEIAPYAARLAVPFLCVTADQDPYGSGPMCPKFVAAARTPDRRELRVPGTDHGIALLHDTGVESAVLAFLARTTTSG